MITSVARQRLLLQHYHKTAERQRYEDLEGGGGGVSVSRLVAGSAANKIYITYGAAHFPGFLKDLQALDPAKTVQSLRWVRPMSLPNKPQEPAGYPVTR